MAYLLDANVFIEAKHRYFAFDICPGFWEWLIAAQKAGQVVSVESVRDELIGRGDELSDWTKSLDSSFFLSPDADVLAPLATLASWVSGRQYRPAAISEFLASADYYLIATAMAHRHTVVTHETPSDGIKRVKIPEPCIAHGVEVINPFMMLRRLGVRFTIKK